MVTLPDANAVYVIGSNEAGIIRVRGINLCKGIKRKGGRSSILEKMRPKGIFFRGTDDWIYKVWYYRRLKANL